MESAGCAELVRLLATPTKHKGNAAGKNSTKVMRICTLVLSLAFAASGQEIEDSDTWARLQIGHDVFTTLHYGDLEVKVYEQLKKPNANKKEAKPWHYFMPVNVLLPDSAECIFNKFTNENELRFSIEFWNDDLRQRIVEHLNDSEGIASAKVAVIPFEQVMLTTTQPSQFYRPTNSWVPYRGQKLMNFSLIFDSITKCRELQDHTRSNPQDSHHFRLMFNVAATNSRSRIALISVHSIRKGSLFGKLEQKFPNADSVLLTAEDANRLLSESTAKVKVDIFDDTEVPNPSSEARIYEMLDQLLIDSRETIKEKSSQLWSSVFYENENYRPDQVTQTVSDIYRRSDKEAQRMLSSLFSNSKSSNIDAALELIKHRLSSRAERDAESSSKFHLTHSKPFQFNVSVNAGVETGDKKSNEKVSYHSGSKTSTEESSSSENQEKARQEIQSLSRQRDRTDVSNDQLAEKLARASANSEEEKKDMQEIFKLLLEGKERVEWQGNKFQPRPMTLSRVNLSKVRTKSSFGSRDVKVTYSKATLTAGVNVPSKNWLEIIDCPAEMHIKQSEAFKNMDSKMKAMNEHLNQLTETLRNVESRLQETAVDLKTKETQIDIKIEQEREKIEVLADTMEKTINQWNAARSQLAEVQRSYERNLQIDREAVAVVGSKLKTLESTTINQQNATRSQLAEVQKTCEKNLREAVADVSNKLNNLESTTINQLKTAEETECPKNIGSKSTCREFRRMGCYCIVEVLKNFYEADGYCTRNNMKLVAIETQEEQDLLRGFLVDNLGSREKYAASFKTSGVDENSDGRWQWTSSKQPLFFRNWGLYGHNEERNLLLIEDEKPFVWFNGRIKNENVLLNDYFICESSAPQQEIKHVTAYVNAKDCPQSIGINSTCAYLDPRGCYCVVLTKSDWIEGSRHCKSQGMELVSIETEAENSQITAFLRGHQSSYTFAFWTSALYTEEKSQWVWSATGESVNYANWAAGEPQFSEGEGHTIMLQKAAHKMVVDSISLKRSYFIAHYICEKSIKSSVNGPRNRQMDKKTCSAGSDWTCRNEVTGCYCHQTINRNWTDASALCKSLGMDLVSIETAAEQLVVASGLPKLAGISHWWTSGSEASGDRWTWAATGRDLNYTNWAADEPTKIDNSAHGVIMRFQENKAPDWMVYPVMKKVYPICEK